MSDYTKGLLEIVHQKADQERPELLTIVPKDAAPGFRDAVVQIYWHTGLRPIDHGNARRLVACWNACEGLDTEAIEIADTFAKIMNDYGRDRAELIVELKTLIANTDPLGACRWSKKARALLARMKVKA